MQLSFCFSLTFFWGETEWARARFGAWADYISCCQWTFGLRLKLWLTHWQSSHRQSGREGASGSWLHGRQHNEGAGHKAGLNSIFMATAMARLAGCLFHCCALLFVPIWQKSNNALSQHAPALPSALAYNSYVLKTVHKNVHLIRQDGSRSSHSAAQELGPEIKLPRCESRVRCNFFLSFVFPLCRHLKFIYLTLASTRSNKLPKPQCNQVAQTASRHATPPAAVPTQQQQQQRQQVTRTTRYELALCPWPCSRS